MTRTFTSQDERVLALTADAEALEVRVRSAKDKIAAAREVWDLASIVRADRQDELDEASDAMDEAYQAVCDAESALIILLELQVELAREISELSGLNEDGTDPGCRAPGPCSCCGTEEE